MNPEPQEPWCSLEGEEYFSPHKQGHRALGYRRKGDPPLTDPPGTESREAWLKRTKGGQKGNWYPETIHNLHFVEEVDTRQADWDEAVKSRATPRIPVSKLICRILRVSAWHDKMKICTGGWVPILELLSHRDMVKKNVKQKEIFSCVIGNGKDRFELSKDMNFIRAVQGHQRQDLPFIKNELVMRKVIPDKREARLMVHATSGTAWDSIKESYLERGSRHVIHFAPHWGSHLRKAGTQVGIYVDVWQLHEKGHEIFEAKNGTLCVPGPICPTEMRRVGKEVSGVWTWEWLDGMPLAQTRVTWDKEAGILRDLRLEANARATAAGLEKYYNEKSGVFVRAARDDRACWEYERRQESPFAHGRRQGGRNISVENVDGPTFKTYRTPDLNMMTQERLEEPGSQEGAMDEAEGSAWETPATETPAQTGSRKRAFPGADWPSPEYQEKQEAIDATYRRYSHD